MIPYGEKVVTGYLNSHGDVQALGALASGTVPSNTQSPWIKVTLIDASNEALSRVEHLITFAFQFDCFAGKDAMEDFKGQEEASLLARTVREALFVMPDQSHEEVVVTQVRFTNMARIPEGDFEQARERYVLDADVLMHAKP